jgi:hypothetical protein
MSPIVEQLKSIMKKTPIELIPIRFEKVLND